MSGWPIKKDCFQTAYKIRTEFKTSFASNELYPGNYLLLEHGKTI